MNGVKVPTLWGEVPTLWGELIEGKGSKNMTVKVPTLWREGSDTIA